MKLTSRFVAFAAAVRGRHDSVVYVVLAASVRVEVVLLLLPPRACCANRDARELMATPVPRFKKFFWHPAAYLPSLDVRCFTTPAPALECAVGPAALPNRTSLARSFRGFNPILRRTLSGSALLGNFARGIVKSKVEPAEHTKPLALRHPDMFVAGDLFKLIRNCSRNLIEKQ